MVELPFLKIINIILGKILHKQRMRILLAKTYEQQTTKHLPNSKSS